VQERLDALEAALADLVAAARAFESSVEVLGRVKSMQQSLLRLGEN